MGSGGWGESGDTREKLQYGFAYVSTDPYNTDVSWNGQEISINDYYFIMDQIAAAPPPPSEPQQTTQPVPTTPVQPTEPQQTTQPVPTPEVHLPQDHIVPLTRFQEYIKEQHP